MTNMIDQFAAWRTALETGKPVEYTKGRPSSGYFKRKARNKDRSIRYDAVAIWRDEVIGEWCCQTSDGYSPTHADEIEELFVSCNSSPISYELYEIVSNGGAWPNEVATIESAPELAPHDAAAAELKKRQDEVKAWLTELGRKPASQEEADKAANFADAFGKIEKTADKARVAEKEPFLESGRAVDAKWKPTIDGAATAKKWAKGLSDDYAKAEAAQRQREADEANAKPLRDFKEAKAKAAAEEAQRIALAAKGVIVPEFAPTPVITAPKAIVTVPVRIGTGSRRQSLRTITSWEIDDASALLRFLASRNVKSDALIAAALRDARALCESGVDVPGMIKTEKQEII